MDDDNLAKATDVRAIAQLMTNASFLKHMAVSRPRGVHTESVGVACGGCCCFLGSWCFV